MFSFSDNWELDIDGILESKYSFPCEVVMLIVEAFLYF